MKQSFALLAAVYLLTSCAMSNRIMETDDTYKEIKSIRLIQNPWAYSSENTGSLSGRQYYSFHSIYLFEEKKKERPVMLLDIQITAPIGTDVLDSVMYLSLDNEKIRIVSTEYRQFEKLSTTSTSSMTTTAEEKPEKDKSRNQEKTAKTVTTLTTTTESNNVQLMNRQYSVPENLWISVVHSEKIGYRLYLGKEGIDVKPNPKETAKLKEFFSKAIQRRDDAIPAIPPGKAKW